MTVYKAFQKEFPNFARWFNHIASFTPQFESLPAGSAPAAPVATEEDDDDVDLFGSDDEVDEDAEKIKQERLAMYAAKKAAKPKPVAKSLVSLDIKPWDDETNLDELLENVKKIEMEGLVWGAHQWVPVGFGIKKLTINIVVEDDKVSTDELQALIEEDEDHVQSTDVAAMSKL